MMKFRTYAPFLVCSAVFLLSLFLALSGKAAEIDSSLYSLYLNTRGSMLPHILLLFTKLGNTAGVVTVVILLFLLPRKMRLVFSLPVAVATLISCSLNEGVKLLVARTRPEVERIFSVHGYSFPSGHAMNNATLYLTILFLALLYIKRPALRRAVWVLVLIPVFIGLSRVYFGVHYLTDVVAGWAMGALIAYSVFLYVRIVSKSKISSH